MHIAALTPVDAPAYRDLMLLAYGQAADAFTSTVQERAALPHGWWVRRVADPEGLGQGLGAREAGRLVGAVALEFSARAKTRHRAELVGLFVRQEARGKGVGRALVEAALALARCRPGLLTVTLTVTEGNEAAIALYRACGFEVTGREPMAIRAGDEFRAKLHLWRRLEPGAA